MLISLASVTEGSGDRVCTELVLPLTDAALERVVPAALHLLEGGKAVPDDPPWQYRLGELSLNLFWAAQ